MALEKEENTFSSWKCLWKTFRRCSRPPDDSLYDEMRFPFCRYAMYIFFFLNSSFMSNNLNAFGYEKYIRVV